ncbi:hypothetical protein L7Q18_32870 [Achromobacter xylosoxidans]|uniref:hypothetical protein n=1 Tax=Alcaligenes xylosoxydans xylosoxydans TaxID=85698 RepID=UPI001F06983F|nr:hypothetical protein [Achromobacter xylosoxidans]MCH1991063.1 hypothetical protein [Achromobacter xylosoxidans]
MTDNEIEAATVAKGTWQYGGSGLMPVRIIGLTFDSGYAIAEADQQLIEGEQPEPLGEQGLLYYAYFSQISGPAFPTVIQAKGFAQSMVRSEINWS